MEVRGFGRLAQVLRRGICWTGSLRLHSSEFLKSFTRSILTFFLLLSFCTCAQVRSVLWVGVGVAIHVYGYVCDFLAVFAYA